MKIRHKRTILSVTAAVMAGVLGAGAFLQSTQVAVQASSEMMPGIETIVSETSESDPFRILEIVDDSTDAEIGYYVSGQESYLKLYQYTPEGSDTPISFSTVEEALEQLPTRELRKQFMMNLAADENGESLFRDLTGVIYDTSAGDIASAAEAYPVSYEEYEEKYNLDEDDEESDWTRMTLEDSREETLTGHFEENSENTGDYTRGEITYSPISQTEELGEVVQEEIEDAEEFFREDISSFFFSESEDGASAPYSLVFAEVDNEKVNDTIEYQLTDVIHSSADGSLLDISAEYDSGNGLFGYFENVYGVLTSEIADDIADEKYTFPGEALTPAESGKSILLIDNLTDADLAASFVSDDGSSVDIDSLTSGESSGDAEQTASALTQDAASQSDSSLTQDDSVQEVIEEEELNSGESSGSGQSERTVTPDEQVQSPDVDSFSSGAVFSSGAEDISGTQDSSGQLVDMEVDTGADLDTGAVGADAFSSGESTGTDSGNSLFSDTIDNSGINMVAEGDISDNSGAASASATTTTETTTEATTEAVTEATTAATTEAVTEATTAASAEASTEGTTESTTETTTETTTEYYDPDKIYGVKDEVGTQSDPYIYYAEEIDEYPYYIYKFAGDLDYVVQKAKDFETAKTNAAEKGEEYSPVEGDIVLEDDQYWIYVQGESNIAREELYIVTGRKQVSYEDVMNNELPGDLAYNYYYRVTQVYFCYEESTSEEETGYFGWYYADYPSTADEVYVEWDEDGDTVYLAPTHYISESTYSLTPGQGGYDFVEGEKDEEGVKNKDYTLEIDHFYYRGGYTSNDWLKRYVFHLTPSDGTEEEDSSKENDFDSFQIDVTTLSAEQFNALYGTEADEDDTDEESDSSGDVDAQAVGDGSGADEASGLGDGSDAEETSGVGDGSDADGTSGLGDGSEDAGDSVSGDDAVAKTIPATAAETALVDISGDTAQSEDGLSADTEALSAELLVGASGDEAGDEAAAVAEASETEGTVSASDGALSIGDTEIVDAEEAFEDGGIVDAEALSAASVAEDIASGAETDEQPGRVSSITDLDAAELPEETRNRELSAYDLIYVNGCVTAVGVDNIVSSNVPTIFNQAKAYSDDVMYTELNTLDVLTDDSNQHYVNKKLYFFRNVEQADGSVEPYNSSLLNLNFNIQFNPEPASEDYSGFGDTDARQGFEEILEYINLENKYRSLDTSETIEPLSYDLSQARAIEYILNYKYKRTIKAKDTIKVLEIEPAKSDGELTRTRVLKWLGYTDEQIASEYYISGVKLSACCYNTNNGEYNPINYACDNNDGTFWISDWKNGHESKNTGVEDYCNKKAHYITISDIPDDAVVTGVSYTPRDNTKSKSGSAVWLRVYVYDKNNTLLKSYDYENLTVKQEEKKLDFGDDEYNGNEIGKIDVVFMESYVGTELKAASAAGSSSGTYASCAEIKLCGAVSDAVETSLPEIELTTMTASEFVGHIDDLNTEYDLIYIGDDDSFRDTASNKTYAAYIMGNGSMLYTHVGAASYGFYPSIGGKNYLKLVGLLDIDYTDSSKSQIRSLSLFNTGEGTIPTGSVAGAGSFRGSGNDITEQQYKALKDFADSGYPVVLADSLVSSDGKEINESTVDNSSWYYQFMSGTLEKDNVVTVSEAEENGIQFFANVAKPVIEFELDENGDECKPPEPEEEDGVLTGVLEESDEGLEYSFKIKNDSEVLPASASYDCRLYLDLNFDGNFGSDEEQQEYIEIVDEEGNVLTTQDGKYQLKVGKTYTLTRKIPSDYYKIIEWKLEVASNTNESVRTSVIGYAKRRTDEVQTINVLQIIPTKRVSWNLSDDYKNTNGVFRKCLEYVKTYYGFDIQITTVTINRYAESADTAEAYLNGGTVHGTEQKAKQMVILGFADAYSNIPNDKGQVDKLVAFAKSGKSVIFSHDTTSSVNVDVYIVGKLDGTTAETTAAGEHVDNHFFSEDERNMGISLNTRFRFIAGLDRYGIMDTSDYVSSDSSGLTISDLIRRGMELTDGETVQGSTVSFERLMELVGDVAFKTGENRNTSFLQTQGYINSQLQNSTMGSYITKTVTQMNEGVITNYPYKIGNGDGTLTVGETHAQSYQLALEEDRDINGKSDGVNDVVVWYCLSGNAEYTQSPNDARNNYYFYSKGNIIYTGAGHGTLNDEEKKLFINAMVAAANVAAVEPEVNFVSKLDPAADTETVRYYMTDLSTLTTVSASSDTEDFSSDTEDSSSDTENSFSTESSSSDTESSSSDTENSSSDTEASTSDTEASSSETKVVNQTETFYFNVQDYNMVSSTLSSEDKGKQAMTAEFYIESSEGHTACSDSDGVTVYEMNDGTYQYADGSVYNSGSANLTLLFGGKKVLLLKDDVTDLTQYSSIDNEPITGSADWVYTLNGNDAYSFTLNNIQNYVETITEGNYSYDDSVSLYVKINSTVSVYGELTTETSWSSIALKLRRLFDLD